MFSSFLLFGYFGPETTMPMASAVVTAFGLMMMLGRNTLRLAKDLFSGAKDSRVKKAPTLFRPHFTAKAKDEPVHSECGAGTADGRRATDAG